MEPQCGDRLALDYDGCFEDYQFPFDEKENLEIRLSDEAAKTFILDDCFDVRDTPLRLKLMDREETLDEILELSEYLQDKYSAEYGICGNDDPIAFFRKYLDISRYEGGCESSLYADGFSEDEEPGDRDSEDWLPEGYHYDEEISFKRLLSDRIQTLQRMLQTYRVAVKKYRKELRKASKSEKFSVPRCGLPDASLLIDETEDIHDVLEERLDVLVEKEAAALPDAVYVLTEECRGILEDVWIFEEDIIENEDRYFDQDDDGPAFSREEFLEINGSSGILVGQIWPYLQ